MSPKAKRLVVVLILLFTLPLVACEKEGTAEKAGKKLDKMLDSAKDKMNDATK